MIRRADPGLAITVVLGLLVAACTTSITSTSKQDSPPPFGVAPGPVLCGDPTPLVTSEAVGQPATSTTAWAVAGPLRFAVYTLDRFAPGVASKVPITVEKPLEAPLSLKGWRCSDGRPLRFWYRSSGEPYHPFVANASALESAGDLVANLESYGAASGINAYGGYMLFTAPGKWKVSVFQREQPLASAIFLVTAG